MRDIFLVSNLQTNYRTRASVSQESGGSRLYISILKYSLDRWCYACCAWAIHGEAEKPAPTLLNLGMVFSASPCSNDGPIWHCVYNCTLQIGPTQPATNPGEDDE